jgi:hypothetical protein
MQECTKLICDAKTPKIRYHDAMARPRILGETKRAMVSLPADLAKAVDDYRFENRITTEAEAIRRLIEAGLSAPSTPSGGAGGKGKTDTPPKPSSRAKTNPT